MTEALSDIFDTIGDLYERAVTGDTPQDGFARLALQLGARHYSIRAITSKSSPSLSTMAWSNWPLVEVFSKWITENSEPVTPWLLSLPSNRAYVDPEVVPPDVMEKTAYYNELIRPIGFGKPTLGTAMACLTIGEGTFFRLGFVDIGANRTGDPQGYFSMKAFGQIIPHLRRALRLLRLSLPDHQYVPTGPASGMRSIIDRLPYGVILIDFNGTVRNVNAAALRLVENSDGITISHNRLRAANGEATLGDLIEHTLAGQTPGGVLHIPKSDRSSHLDVMVYSLQEGALSLRTGVMVIVLDPSARHETSIETLASFGGLTRAEALLALSLYQGLTRANHAELYGISLSTVKFHLSNLMLKIGTNRQADIVRWVAERIAIIAPQAPLNVPSNANAPIITSAKKPG